MLGRRHQTSFPSQFPQWRRQSGGKFETRKRLSGLNPPQRYKYRVCQYVKNRRMLIDSRILGWSSSSMYDILFRPDRSQESNLFHVSFSVTTILPKSYANTARFVPACPSRFRVIKWHKQFSQTTLGTMYKKWEHRLWLNKDSPIRGVIPTPSRIHSCLIDCLTFDCSALTHLIPTWINIDMSARPTPLPATNTTSTAARFRLKYCSSVMERCREWLTWNLTNCIFSWLG